MSVNIVIDSIDGNGIDLLVRGTLVPTGSYVTGGDTVDFTGVASTITMATDMNGPANQITSQYLKALSAWSEGGNLAQDYYGIPPTTGVLSTAKFKVRTAGGSSEISATTYPTAVTGDVVRFEARFKKNNV